MSKVFKEYKDESRIGWGSTIEKEGFVGVDRIQIGCLQRIADATELMAKRHQDLVDERDYYKRRYDETTKTNRSLRLRIAALKGVITKLKRHGT